jgi:hypothetical protein
VQVSSVAEGGQHDRTGDADVGAEVQGVAGVVVEPSDDLGVRTGCAVGPREPEVGEVGLPGLVGLLGLEPDVGALGPLGRVRGHLPGADQDPVDRGSRQRDLVAMLEVPVDGVRARVEAGLVELFAEPQDELDPVLRGGAGAGLRGARARFEGGLALVAVAGHESADPALGDPVGTGDLRLGLTGQDGGDDKTTFRHRAASDGPAAQLQAPCR